MNDDIEGVRSCFNSSDTQIEVLAWSPKIDDLHGNMVRSFFEAWEEMPRRADNAPPNTKDFDVFRFRVAMGFMIYLDVIEGGADFRFRVFGSRVVDSIGFDWTGRLVSEMPLSANCRAYLATSYRAIIHRKEPLFLKHKIQHDETTVEWNTFLVPMSSDTKPVARILGLSVPTILSPRPARGMSSSF
ncbi:MAG: PAS domain-containing protein [Alphaproteobacteria bacterium]|nr:PAS domain-containing protein [Alphaproteobacteria bacterium]